MPPGEACAAEERLVRGPARAGRVAREKRAAERGLGAGRTSGPTAEGRPHTERLSSQRRSHTRRPTPGTAASERAEERVRAVSAGEERSCPHEARARRRAGRCVSRHARRGSVRLEVGAKATESSVLNSTPRAWQEHGVGRVQDDQPVRGCAHVTEPAGTAWGDLP